MMDLAELGECLLMLTRTGEILHLVVPGENVKNGVAIEAELTAETVGLLDLYLERCRPLLLDRTSSWLFPGQGGKAKSPLTLASQIKKFVLLPEEWSLAGGELTPTLKLKRRELLRKYASEIELLYAEANQTDDRFHLLAQGHLPNLSNRT